MVCHSAKFPYACTGVGFDLLMQVLFYSKKKNSCFFFHAVFLTETELMETETETDDEVAVAVFDI